MNSPAATLGISRLNTRRAYWLGIMLWALVSWLIGSNLSHYMTFRINDLSVIPGAGMIMRDTEGVYFHVDYAGKAKRVYPTAKSESAGLPSEYSDRCIDCVLVTGEKMSETNDFCAAGSPATLPKLEFQVPCRSWAVIDDGAKVVSVTLFLIPLLILPVVSAFIRVLASRKLTA